MSELDGSRTPWPVGLRVRLWIEGELCSELPFPPVGDGELQYGVSQMKAIVLADEDDKRWYVEIFDPDLGPDQQPQRFGTDTSAMANPTELPEP